MRNASGTEENPPRRISSPVITKIAAGAADKLSAFLEAEVTWMFMRSSMLIEVRSTGFAESCANCCVAAPVGRADMASTQASHFAVCPLLYKRNNLSLNTEKGYDAGR